MVIGATKKIIKETQNNFPCMVILNLFFFGKLILFFHSVQSSQPTPQYQI